MPVTSAQDLHDLVQALSDQFARSHEPAANKLWNEADAHLQHALHEGGSWIVQEIGHLHEEWQHHKLNLQQVEAWFAHHGPLLARVAEDPLKLAGEAFTVGGFGAALSGMHVGIPAAIGQGIEKAKRFADTGAGLLGVGTFGFTLGNLVRQIRFARLDWSETTLKGASGLLTDGVEATSKFDKVLGPLSLVGVAVDGGDFISDLAKGASFGSILVDESKLGLDAASIAIPEVGLAAGAWQVGATIGTWIATDPHLPVAGLISTADDAVVQAGAETIHGDVTTSSTAAQELVDRYSGPMGPVHASEDWFSNALHGW